MKRGMCSCHGGTLSKWPLGGEGVPGETQTSAGCIECPENLAPASNLLSRRGPGNSVDGVGSVRRLHSRLVQQ